jgi:hypothetical protein
MGWNTATRLAQYHEVTVVCCGDLSGRRDIEPELADYFRLPPPPIPGLTVPVCFPFSLSRQRDAFAAAAVLHARRREPNTLRACVGTQSTLNV